jgi:crotonobetainyl-CoA:carnitine CoA-transferase CaiB-like acyl-CoA transferase
VRHPRLVVCSITGFGPDSSRRAYDHVVQAGSGFMAANARADGTPQRVGFPVIDYAVGMQAAQAVLAALLRRERQGAARERGEWLQVTMNGAALTLLGPVYAPQMVSGITPPRTASTAFSGSALSGTFAASDGHLALVCNAPDQAVGLQQALAEAGVDEATRQRIETAARQGDVVTAQQLLGEAFGQGTAAQWETRLTAHGVPATTVRSAAAAAAEAAAATPAAWPQVDLPLPDGPRRVRTADRPARRAAAPRCRHPRPAGPGGAGQGHHRRLVRRRRGLGAARLSRPSHALRRSGSRRLAGGCQSTSGGAAMRVCSMPATWPKRSL